MFLSVSQQHKGLCCLILSPRISIYHDHLPFSIFIAFCQHTMKGLRATNKKKVYCLIFLTSLGSSFIPVNVGASVSTDIKWVSTLFYIFYFFSFFSFYFLYHEHHNLSFESNRDEVRHPILPLSSSPSRGRPHHLIGILLMLVCLANPAGRIDHSLTRRKVPHGNLFILTHRAKMTR